MKTKSVASSTSFPLVPTLLVCYRELGNFSSPPSFHVHIYEENPSRHRLERNRRRRNEKKTGRPAKNSRSEDERTKDGGVRGLMGWGRDGAWICMANGVFGPRNRAKRAIAVSRVPFCEINRARLRKKRTSLFLYCAIPDLENN